MTNVRRAIYLTATWNKRRNKEQAMALPALAKFFDTAIVAVPSMWEVPDLEEHAAGRVILSAYHEGMKVIILPKATPTFERKMTKGSRHLWPMLTNPKIFRDHGFWAANLAWAHALAAQYYAESGLYCEPHAREFDKWTETKMSATERQEIWMACRQALEIVEPVDWMLPYGSMDRRRYSWPFAAVVGKRGRILGSGTYKRKDRKFYDKARPPVGYDRSSIVNSGFWAMPTKTGRIFWSPSAVVEWERKEWKAYAKAHPEAVLYWVYWSTGIIRLAEMFAELA